MRGDGGVDDQTPVCNLARTLRRERCHLQNLPDETSGSNAAQMREAETIPCAIKCPTSGSDIRADHRLGMNHVNSIDGVESGTGRTPELARALPPGSPTGPTLPRPTVGSEYDLTSQPPPILSAQRGGTSSR